MKLKECKSKEEKLQELKARAKAKGDNIKGFHDLFFAIYEKFDFTEKEALRRTSEAPYSWHIECSTFTASSFRI